jgi:large subunit ribosomal protein L16
MINPTPRQFRKPNRKLIRHTYENKSNKLCFGNFGLQALEKGFLTVRQIEAVRRTITGRLKRKGKVWIRAFPDYARTAKPKEVRMGRGKGNVDHWVCIIKPGRILFEVKSINAASVKEALDFTLRKLPIKAHVISRNFQL